MNIRKREAKSRKLFDDSTIDEIAVAALNGEKAVKLARAYHCSASTVVSYAEQKVSTLDKFNFKEYIDQLKIPGSGRLITARTLWKKWKA